MPETFGTGEAGETKKSCGSPAEPLPPAVHWNEIRLVGEDGSAVPWEEYLVALPDGSKARGYLDGKGLAKIENIRTSGTCQVSFPRLDRDAWAPAS